MVNTLVNDTVGTGPRLNVTTGSPELNKRIETAFTAWADEIDLTDILLKARRAKFTDGETFILLSNATHEETAVELHPQVLEAEYVQDPNSVLP